MPTNREAWTMGQMAAQHGLDVDTAAFIYGERRDGVTGEQLEIFRDGYEGVNEDYALGLDLAAA
jgi:hypothetical protein